MWSSTGAEAMVENETSMLLISVYSTLVGALRKDAEQNLKVISVVVFFLFLDENNQLL